MSTTMQRTTMQEAAMKYCAKYMLERHRSGEWSDFQRESMASQLHWYDANHLIEMEITHNGKILEKQLARKGATI